jgi:hypothetical protein
MMIGVWFFQRYCAWAEEEGQNKGFGDSELRTDISKETVTLL